MKRILSKIGEFLPQRVFTNKKLPKLNYSTPFTSSKFTFIQIGANDGVLMDPIYEYVKKYKWTGALVEPVPEYFDSLKLNYSGHKNLQFYNVAVCKENKRSLIYVVDSSSSKWLKGMPSLNKETVINGGKVVGVKNLEQKISKKTINCITLRELVKKTGFKKINLMVLDIEGSEPIVLEQLTDIKSLPEVILYEHHALKPLERVSLKKKLKKLGYSCFNAGFPFIDTIAVLNRN